MHDALVDQTVYLFAARGGPMLARPVHAPWNPVHGGGRLRGIRIIWKKQ